MMMQIDSLLIPNVTHGFFGRRGGVSTGVYDSLNCGYGSDDRPECEAENIRRVCVKMGATPSQLARVYQVHSAECVYVRAPFSMDARPQADAMVTDQPGVVLGILTADCAPVLFVGAKADGTPVIGAAHAGWQGALKGVVEQTVAAMCNLGAQLFSIRAAVGPCITRASYEVSVGFEQAFLERDAGDEIFFRPGRAEGKLLFDLPGYIARRLQVCGVRQITLSDIDTLSNEQDYFSYRRACLSGARECGRQMSAIMIVP